MFVKIVSVDPENNDIPTSALWERCSSSELRSHYWCPRGDLNSQNLVSKTSTYTNSVTRAIIDNYSGLCGWIRTNGFSLPRRDVWPDWHTHRKFGGPVEDRTPIWALQVPRVPQYHYQPKNLVDAVGFEPTVLWSGRFTVFWGYQFSYTSILKYTPYLSHDENKFHLQTQIVRPRI